MAMGRGWQVGLVVAALAGGAALSVLPRALAEIPPRSEADLREEATVIVSGKLLRHYRCDDAKEGSDYVDSLGLLEVALDEVERGEGLKPGTHLLVRVWQAKERPRGWTGPSGHWLPGTGSRVRVYAKPGEGGLLHALSPNGVLQIEEDVPAKAEPEPMPGK